MMLQITLLLFQVLALILVSAQGMRYVKPDNASSSSCPDQPCLTLDLYVEHSHVYFTTGATFVFLPGNHSLKSSISLNSVSNITLRGTEHNSSATITCTANYSVTCRNVSNLNIQWLTFSLNENKFYYLQKVVFWTFNSRGIMISNCTFQGSERFSVTALYATRSSITILGSVFGENKGNTGGAIHVSVDSHLVLSDTLFTGNKASFSGGAVYVGRDSTVRLASSNRFSHNAANKSGGAIDCNRCTIHITGNSSFESNYCSTLHYVSGGGAVAIISGYIITSGTMLFSNSSAAEGGGVYLRHSTALLTGHTIFFSNNSAEIGGGLRLLAASVRANATHLKFIGNSASRFGGGLSSGSEYGDLKLMNMVEISATFTQNKAECGGAIYVAYENNLTLVDVSIRENSGSALCISNSHVNFTGTIEISHNRGTAGGGVSSRDSTLIFIGDTRFEDNTAITGGAINSIQDEISFHSCTRFTHNRAHSEGGAIHALGSKLSLVDTTTKFESNLAHNGGALYLSAATLTLSSYSIFKTHNNAAEYGGVIYFEDTPTTAQCSFVASSDNTDQFLSLPPCFLQHEDHTLAGNIDSQHNTAEMDGNFLYGGLLDKCRPYQAGALTTYNILVFYSALSENTTAKIASGAYELCICHDSQECIRSMGVELFRGQSFSLSLLAIAQGGIPTSTLITAVTRTSRLSALQNVQALPKGCSNLTYHLYSADDHDQLILYPDGPCRDRGLARVTLNVTFLPCPGGFTQSGVVCICEERLSLYDVECTVEEGIQIVKNNGSNFWMGVVHTENGSYGGLILYEICPAEYCKTQCCECEADGQQALPGPPEGVEGEDNVETAANQQQEASPVARAWLVGSVVGLQEGLDPAEPVEVLPACEGIQSVAQQEKEGVGKEEQHQH